MNNAFIAIENVSLELEESVDNTVIFRQKETELMAIIDALNKVAESKEWAVLKEKVFNGIEESLNNALMIEVKKQPLNGPKIHNINGQIQWAHKYSDLSGLAFIYKQELINVRNQLNAT